MKKICRAVFLCAGMLIYALSVRADTLVVLDKSEFRAEVIDPGTRKVLAKIPTGRGPHEVAISPDGHTAYVTNFGPFGVYKPGENHTDPGNTITVIDLAARRVKATLDLGTHRGPHGIAISRDGKYIWITSETPQSLLQLDAVTGKLLKSWNTNQDRSHLLVVSPDERKVYVSNTVSGSVSVVDRSSGTVKVIPVGPGTEAIAMSPNGREAWAGRRGDDQIAVISTDTDAIVATFPSVGKGPVRLRFTPDGAQVWCTQGTSDEVSIFDAHARKLLATIKVEPGPGGIVFSPDGTRAYVASARANKVTVMDVASRKILNTITTGTEPDGVAWAPTR